MGEAGCFPYLCTDSVNKQEIKIIPLQRSFGNLKDHKRSGLQLDILSRSEHTVGVILDTAGSNLNLYSEIKFFSLKGN